jgi:plastocyanin
VTDRRWMARLVVAGLALTMLAAACSSNNGSTTGGSSPAGVATTPGSGSSAAAGSAQAVKQANFSFSPSTFTVKSGDSITVQNTTTDTQHTFTVTGQSIDVTLDPSTSQDVKISLAPGTYPFICRFHASRGMTGTLTVN